MKIIKKIVLMLLGVSIIPLVVMSVQEYHCVHQAIYDIESRHLQTILIAQSNSISSWINERINDLDSLKKIPCIQKGLEVDNSISMQKEIKESIKAMYESSYNFKLIFYKKSRREVIASYPKLEGPFTMSSIIKSASFDNSETFYQVDDNNKLVNIVLCSYIDKAKGACVGGVINLENIFDERIYANQENMNIYLISQNGKILNSERNEHLIPMDFLTSEISLQNYKKAGETVYGMYSSLPLLGMYLGIEESESDIFNWVNIIKDRILIVMFITFLFIVYISLKLAKSISSPIEKLTHTAINISKGSLNERAEIKTNDEIGKLAGAFNQMLDQLNEINEKLINNRTLAELGQFSASIVHEMRNPLSAIKMNIQILSDSISNMTTEREHLEIALGQVENIENMLTELLDYSKEMKIHKQIIPLSDIIDKTKLMMNESIKNSESNIRILCDIDYPLYCDEAKIVQVFSNLIRNSIQAKGKGVNIEINCKKGDNSDKVQIIYLDNGPGISQENIENVFLPFFTTKDNGIGLGLAIVKRIIDAHNGNISVSNRVEEKGLKFILSIPSG